MDFKQEHFQALMGEPPGTVAKLFFSFLPDVVIGAVVAYYTKSVVWGLVGAVAAKVGIQFVIWLQDLNLHLYNKHRIRGNMRLAIQYEIVKNNDPKPALFPNPSEYLDGVMYDRNVQCDVGVSADKKLPV